MSTQVRSDKSPLPRIPAYARGHWFWGYGLTVLRQPLEMFTQLRELGPVVELRLGFYRAFVINEPELIKQVFLDPRTYTKQTESYERLRSIMGLGLLTNDGDFWKRQRRIAQPAFHRERIAGFAETMLRNAQKTADRLQQYAKRGEPFDVADEMIRSTLPTVCETLLGTDAGRAIDVVGRAFSEFNHLMTPHVHAFVALPLWVPTPANRRIRQCVAELDETVYDLIARRRAQNNEGRDLLSMLLRARDEETGEGMSDRQLRDEVMAILLAGHETTATSMTWTLHLLSQNPVPTQRLTDEIDAVLGGRPPALADLPRLRYTRMVLEESLRLYPSLWAATRSVSADADLGGYRIPRDSLVIAPSYSVHRSPALWKDPEAFMPERFDPENPSVVHRYAYFPFIGGPRQCIGMSFAQMQSQILLTTLAQRYHFSPVPGHPIELEPLITLRPRYGVRVTIKERTAAQTESTASSSAES